MSYVNYLSIFYESLKIIIYFYWYIRIDHLRHQKYENKQLTLIRLEFLKVVFPGGRGSQFDPPFLFQEELI